MAHPDQGVSIRCVTPATAGTSHFLASLAFWLSLFACAFVYGVVFLAPKLIKNVELARAERNSQWRLLELQRRIDYLDRVARAYEVDPAFRREKARSDFHVNRLGEQPIPVPSRLTLQIGGGRGDNPPLRAEAAPAAWYEPCLRQLVDQPRLGTILLSVSAVALLLAFTFLQPSGKQPPV